MSTPYQSHSETSIRAAVAKRPNAKTESARVLAFIEGKKGEGATDQEIQFGLALDASTERPRRVDLVRWGFVVDSGQKRETVSGRKAVVWRRR